MKDLDAIIKMLPDYEQTAKRLNEVLLANLVMVGEIPAPTFNEQERVDFIINRFKEGKLDSQWVDEGGNAVGSIEGNEGDKNILVVAHADTVFTAEVDHTLKVKPEQVIGPGVADNSLGLSVLTTLPLYLEEAGITLNDNLILVATTRSLGRGNLKGLRSFLSNFKHPIRAGLSLEGAQIGRLSHTSIGMLRAEIRCVMPDTYDWTRFGRAGAILALNDLINHINKIETPQRPKSRIVFSSIRAGSSFTTAKRATLRFEIRSESLDIVNRVENRLREIIKQVSSQSAAIFELEILAERRPGGTNFTHPLVQNAHRILEELNIESKPGPSTSALSTFIEHEIPAITLGISEGSNIRNENEWVKIEPVSTGIAQVIATIQAIDGGFCEEDR